MVEWKGEEMKNKVEPNYYAIIPANVRYDNKLRDKAKFLYGEITALCNQDGYCYATNKYFADLYNVSKETISRLLKSLKDRGYIDIKIEYEEDSKQVKRRLIYLLTEISRPIDNLIRDPIDKKVKENNTSINNIISILVDFFNDTNKFSKITKITESRKNKIKKRLNEQGYDNFIKSIEIASKSDFLTGKNNRNWRMDFDWLIANDTNIVKVLEGKYNNKPKEFKSNETKTVEDLYGNFIN